MTKKRLSFKKKSYKTKGYKTKGYKTKSKTKSKTKIKSIKKGSKNKSIKKLKYGKQAPHEVILAQQNTNIKKEMIINDLKRNDELYDMGIRGTTSIIKIYTYKNAMNPEAKHTITIKYNPKNNKYEITKGSLFKKSVDFEYMVKYINDIPNYIDSYETS